MMWHLPHVSDRFLTCRFSPMPFHFFSPRPPFLILFQLLLSLFPMALLINFSVLLLPSLHTHTFGTFTEQQYLQFGLSECKGNFRLIRDLSLAFLKIILFFGFKLKWLVFAVSLFTKGNWIPQNFSDYPQFKPGYLERKKAEFPRSVLPWVWPTGSFAICR